VRGNSELGGDLVVSHHAKALAAFPIVFWVVWPGTNLGVNDDIAYCGQGNAVPRYLFHDRGAAAGKPFPDSAPIVSEG
jgi:hypothetical protein